MDTSKIFYSSLEYGLSYFKNKIQMNAFLDTNVRLRNYYKLIFNLLKTSTFLYS